MSELKKSIAKTAVIGFIRQHQKSFDRYPESTGIVFDSLENKPLELLVGYVRLYNKTFERDFGSLEYQFHQYLKDSGVFDFVSNIKTEIIYNNPSYSPLKGILFYEMKFTNTIGKTFIEPGRYDTGFIKHGRLICWDLKDSAPIVRVLSRIKQ